MTPRHDDVWAGVARRCEWATFFHTPLWRDLATAAHPRLTDKTIHVELPGGRRAVYPLIQKGNGTSSTFAGCYGGPIAEGGLAPDDIRFLHAEAIRTTNGDVEVLTGPLFDTGQALPAGFSASPYSTHILSLESGYEAVSRDFARGHRSSIRKGVKAGVEVELVTAESDYSDYFSIYEDSIDRWGEQATSHYPWELFRAAQRLAERRPENVQLWLARRGGRPAAGALMFYWNRHAVYWHGASSREHFEVRPANVLFAQVIRDACERGFASLDFNPSGGHAGVAEFKRRFGALERPLWHLVHSDQASAVAKLRRSLSRSTR